MKQQEVFKKIGGIIKELNEQYEYLQTVTGDLNELELELFIANAHFLTDHIEILAKLNRQNSNAQKPAEKRETANEEKYFEPVVQQVKPGEGPGPATAEIVPAKTDPLDDQPVPQIDFGSEDAGDTYSFIREEPETIRHELVLDESMNWEDDEDVPENEITDDAETSTITDGAKNNPSANHAIQTAADQSVETADKTPDDEKPLTINQKISSQLADKPGQPAPGEQPIADIKQAITLNDKLLYIKDLFNGYSLAYSEAIEILNRFSTFDEATRFLNTNYVTKNNWESKAATMEKFYALLKRRYS